MTALVSKEADKESEGPGLPKSGMYLAPMGNIYAVVNENLKNCDICKDTPLVLELDRRIRFASNWKLSCRSCTLQDEKLRQSVCHLKRCLTLAPIEKDLINYDLLDEAEKDYLFRYHLEIYSKYCKFLNRNERKWLASFIK